MIRILLLFFFITANSVLHAQDWTTFILVRHAEKASDGTKNPPLTTAGAERAKNLKSFLEKQELSALYSTPFKRTQETLQPLAAQKGLEIQSYDPYAKKEWLQSVLTKNKGGTIVISGHSNTIPLLANALLGTVRFEQFDDSDYSNLVLIVCSEVGKGKLIHLSF